MWFSLAAASGIQDAAENRRKLEGELTPAQIAEGKNLSARFVPRKAQADSAQ